MKLKAAVDCLFVVLLLGGRFGKNPVLASKRHISSVDGMDAQRARWALQASTTAVRGKFFQEQRLLGLPSPFNPSIRIGDPISAYVDEFPSVASVSHDGQHVCAATAVSKLHVLTTASCCATLERLNDTKVMMGSLSLSNHPETRQDFSVLKMHVHPDWRQVTGSTLDPYDFCLMELHEPIAKTARVSYIQKANIGSGSTRFPHGSRALKMAGWGAWYFSKFEASDRLHRTFFPLSTEETDQMCQKIPNYDPAAMFCLNDVLVGKKPCFGDMGNPLMAIRMLPVEKLTLVGVASPVLGCMHGPSVFLAVEHVKDWMFSFIRGWSDSLLRQD